MRRSVMGVVATFALLAILMLPSLETKAGVNIFVQDKDSLGSGGWSNPEEDVLVEEGTLVFPEYSTEYTRYISKLSVERTNYFSQMASVSASVNFSKMPVGKSFIMAFGLESIETMSGETGNAEVFFVNDGGIKVGITAYDQDGNAVAVVQPKTCGISLKQSVAVKTEIDVNGVIKVFIRGKEVCTGTLPVTGEGHVGFMQTGECEVKISNLEVTYYKYDRPENPNVNEEFESGAMDVSVLTGRAITLGDSFPQGLKVENYNGSQVLRFRNVREAYVGSRYRYSNFELTFDVPYLCAERVYDDKGFLKEESQTEIILCIGNETADCTTMEGWKMAKDAIFFTNYGVYSYNYRDHWEELAKDPFAENGRPFSMKLSVVDSVVTVGIKWMEEDEFSTVLTYKLPEMPNGYVQIWTIERANFAVDNLKIVNLDDSPDLIETEFKAAALDKPEDAVYKPMEKVYKTDEPNALSLGQWNWWYIPVAIVAVVGAVTIIIAYGSAKKRKKEAANNEK